MRDGLRSGGPGLPQRPAEVQRENARTGPGAADGQRIPPCAARALMRRLCSCGRIRMARLGGATHIVGRTCPLVRAMPGANTRSGLQADYFILSDWRADGPVIGRHDGRLFTAAVVDDLGRRFVYAGAVPRCPDGTYDTDALGDGEWIVEPGLVYRSDEATALRAMERQAERLGPDLT